MGRLNWKVVQVVPGAEAAMPRLPGIYVYVSIRRIWGLPIQVDWVYVGRAANLQRRIAQHRTPIERNADLRKWLISNQDGEIWYVVMENASIRSTERFLIRNLRPRFNIVRYKTKD